MSVVRVRLAPLAHVGTRRFAAEKLMGPAVIETSPPRPAEPPSSKSTTVNPVLLGLAGFLAIGLVFGALALIVHGAKDSGFLTRHVTTVSGLTMFAVFFVAAQALERLLEPISSFLLPKDDASDKYTTALDEADEKVAAWARAVSANQNVAAAKADAETALQAAADAKATVDRLQQVRTVLFWAIATILAMWASAALKLYFLRTVGISGAARWLEVLATGLIIGAGTKPLHDLVSAISANAEAAAQGGS